MGPNQPVMPSVDGMCLLAMISAAGMAPSIIIASAIDERIIRSVELMAGAHGFDVLGLLPKPASLATLEILPAKHRAIEIAAQSEPPQHIETSEIRAALGRGAIEPFFQPKVAFASGRVCGAEALIRWRHPAHGLLRPNQILRQIEAAGELTRMTWTVNEHAVAWCSQWRKQGRDINISVNLSIAAISDPRFPTTVHDLVQRAGIGTDHLIFEVTETNAMHDVAGWLEAFSQLRMHGFGISLDDFGVGFSSLQQLSRIPFTELKLDRSFVTGALDPAASVLDRRVDGWSREKTWAASGGRRGRDARRLAPIAGNRRRYCPGTFHCKTVARNGFRRLDPRLDATPVEPYVTGQPRDLPNVDAA